MVAAIDSSILRLLRSLVWRRTRSNSMVFMPAP
jgi:hypothetical protein